VAFEENGYVPIGAFDGKEGWEKAEAEEPDLFILDVMMPKRTGFTLFKQIRKDERFKDTPVIMLTGVTASLAQQDDAADDTLEQPFGALRESLRKVINEMKEGGLVKPELFIEKPVDPEDIVEQVRGLIG